MALTDKDMTERNVIKDEIPYAALQLCLYHVQRTFGREVVCEKMGITSGQRYTILQHLKGITYSKSEEEYLDKYKSMCEIIPISVRNYYDRNWHSIKEQWVVGFKNEQFNLANHTTNRVESLFRSLKASVSHRGSIQTLIQKFMHLLSLLRDVRRRKYITSTSTCSTYW